VGGGGAAAPAGFDLDLPALLMMAPAFLAPALSPLAAALPLAVLIAPPASATSFHAFRAPSRLGGQSRVLEVVELLGVVKARKEAVGSWRLRVRWADRATASVISLADVVTTAGDAPFLLPATLVRWVAAVVAAGGDVPMQQWWADELAWRP
jgi:hypothetical protein